MSDKTTPFDGELELRALHARAYGPDSDIQEDPVALARLVELEAARAEAASTAASEAGQAAPAADMGPPEASSVAAEDPAEIRPVPEPPPTIEPAVRASLVRRLASSTSRLAAVAAVACITVVAVTEGAAMLLEPRPDASLSPSGASADDLLIGLVRNSGPIDIDLSTLRSFEPFHGIEPWSAVDDYGNLCLILIERSRERLVEAQCTPSEADLIADYGAWPASDDEFRDALPDGSIVRFHHRGDTVEAVVHPSRAGE